jgi:hypothetical protein
VGYTCHHGYSFTYIDSNLQAHVPKRTTQQRLLVPLPLCHPFMVRPRLSNYSFLLIQLSCISDVSVLPSGAPGQLLTAPSGSSAVFIAFSVACMIIFFVTFTLISFSHKMGGKASSLFNSPVLQRTSAWFGFFGFLVGMYSPGLDGTSLSDDDTIGLTTLLIVRMWFGKAIQDFNASIAQQGKNGPSLIASSGNAFTSQFVLPIHSRTMLIFPLVAWVAYAFYAIPIVCSLAKLNVTTGSGKGV